MSNCFGSYIQAVTIASAAAVAVGVVAAAAGVVVVAAVAKLCNTEENNLFKRFGFLISLRPTKSLSSMGRWEGQHSSRGL